MCLMSILPLAILSRYLHTGLIFYKRITQIKESWGAKGYSYSLVFDKAYPEADKQVSSNIQNLTAVQQVAEDEVEVTNANGSYIKYKNGVMIQRGWNWEQGNGTAALTPKTIALPCTGVGLNVSIELTYAGYKDNADPTSLQDSSPGAAAPTLGHTNQTTTGFYVVIINTNGALTSASRLLFTWVWHGHWK